MGRLVNMSSVTSRPSAPRSTTPRKLYNGGSTSGRRLIRKGKTRPTPSRYVDDSSSTRTEGCEWQCPDGSGGTYDFTCAGPCPCECFPVISTGSDTVLV